MVQVPPVILCFRCLVDSLNLEFAPESTKSTRSMKSTRDTMSTMREVVKYRRTRQRTPKLPRDFFFNPHYQLLSNFFSSLIQFYPSRTEPINVQLRRLNGQQHMPEQDFSPLSNSYSRAPLPHLENNSLIPGHRAVFSYAYILKMRAWKILPTISNPYSYNTV